MPEHTPETTYDATLESDDGLADIIESLPGPSGHFQFRGWDLPFWLNEPAEEDGRPTAVNAKNPAVWEIRTREGRYVPFLFIWEGVPEPFKKILLYHEAQEATLALGNSADYIVGGPQAGRMDRHEAHVIAKRLHEAIAPRLLNPEQLESFRKWDASLQTNAIPF